MRPHRLRLRAFGPFPGEVEVDLDALAASGLFLLHGETGSGKTTLLDGIGFALYGRVPGVRGKTGRLRSDHAPADVRTEVELEVTLGGRRWRITRSPAQERAKARGTGTTTEQARIHLEELRDGDWASVSTRIDEAASELDPLLGMSADQFFQVVLLPQGEFARFLRADSKERGELLQRLFATQRFKAVEDWLVQRRIGTSSALAAARQALDVLAARVGQVVRVDAPEELPAGWGRSLLAQATVAAFAAADAAAQELAVRDGCRAAAEQAGRLRALQGRRSAALALLAELDAAAPGHAAVGVELRAAGRAAELAAVLDEATAREREHVTAGAAEAAARARLVPLSLAVDTPAAAVRAAADAARRRTGRLEAVRAVADALSAEQAQVAAAVGEQAQAAGVLAALAVRLEELPLQREAARLRVAAARAAAEGLPAAEARAGVLATAVREAQGLQSSLARLEQLREEHLLARETHVSLREKEDELRDARLVTMIAELAGRLEDGAPCEVCGATSHPDPYMGAGDGVTRDDEDRARLAAEQAAREVADVAARAAAETAVADGYRERLAATGETGGPAELEPACADATAALAQLRAAAGGFSGATTALERADAALAAAQADRVRLEGDAAGAARRAQEAAGRAAGHQARLEAELEGAADLATALAVAATTATTCDAALEAAGAAERAAAEAVRTAAAAVTAAHAAGFGSVDEATAALRTAAWRADAELRRRAHDDARAGATAALADAELQDLPEVPADVEGATAALATADTRLREAGGAEAAAADRARALAQLVPELDAAAEALVPLVASAAQARRLADLCTGGGSNALRMTLTSFVLAARLEQVAEVASARLLRMTQGRYSLVHTDGTAKGGARSGLGLLARDTWTGQDRDTSTLSGGETFLASLALALGLADVVQAEAGGTRIEALFVDEGFGTLDEDTLDEVMDVLDGLREGGRVVGLVSHVAELRARIPAQVRVHKTRTGSSLELVGV